MTSTPIEREYRDLLVREGLEHILQPPNPALVANFLDTLNESQRKLVTETRYVDPFVEINAHFQQVLTNSGLTIPGAVYIGQYPHYSFNAQARRLGGGTLILLHTGLRTLLDRVGVAIGSSLLTYERDAVNGVRLEQPTKEQELRRKQADEALAFAIIAYLSGDKRHASARLGHSLDERGLFGFLIAQSAEYFAVGHEFGHLLAGHLHEPPKYAEALRREYEADELALLLLLRGLDESTPFLVRGITLAGPFVFLAVHHLVTRVQNEVYELPPGLESATHPPSDERAAVLRGALTELADRSLLQFADACVSWLSIREGEIVEAARQLLPSYES